MIEVVAGVWELSKYAFDGYIWARKTLKKTSDHIVPRVEKLVNKGSVKCVDIRGLVTNPTNIIFKGEFSPSAKIAEIVMQKREVDCLNEVHGLVDKWDGLQSNDVYVESTDFLHIQAMRQIGLFPNILSAGALLVCPEKRRVILHRRSPDSATYPSRLHIMGGAYKPPVVRGCFDSPGDRNSIEFTMVREVFEETGIIVRRYHEPLIAALEVETGFVQYNFLGVRVTTAQYSALEANTEGRILSIDFDELEERLGNKEEWVPSGKAMILMWLGLGAPGAGSFGRRVKFNGKSPAQLFNDLV